jgi:farnesyl-diphosphate farnesyltransferase
MMRHISIFLFILCVLEAVCWVGVFTSRAADPSHSKRVERDNAKLTFARRHSESANSLSDVPSSTRFVLGHSLWFKDWAFLAILFSILAVFGLSTEKIRAKLPTAFSKRLTHLEYFSHPKELFDMFYFKLTQKLPQIPPNLNENDRWCFKKLIQVSRSFSAPILALDQELSVPICVFYLVLRGLDTIEDDMAPHVETKKKELRTFYQKLRLPGFTLSGFGEKPAEIDLLQNFDKVIDMFSRLKPKYQNIIQDVTKEMGFGMAKYLETKVITIADWEEYCHYVAGVVGEGLSRIFSASQLEDPKLAEVTDLSNAMGMYLQKTNIIRDYLEDISQNPPRVFYPKDVWSKYAHSIEEFKDPKNIKAAVCCLNELITDAMKHATQCLDYMKMIRERSVFRFCAIPQVMAIATLEKCYNNPDVFRYEVKIRKGTAVQMIMNANDYATVCRYFKEYAQRLLKKIPKDEPNGDKLRDCLKRLIERCQADLS